MALFIMQTKNRPAVHNWFMETVKRSKDSSAVKNPFTWKLKLERSDNDLLLVCDAQPIIFNFAIFGWFSAVGVLMVWGVNIAFWLLIMLGMMSYFWTADFYYRMSILALKKNGYRGEIKRIKPSEYIRRRVL